MTMHSNMDLKHFEKTEQSATEMCRFNYMQVLMFMTSPTCWCFSFQSYVVIYWSVSQKVDCLWKQKTEVWLVQDIIRYATTPRSFFFNIIPSFHFPLGMK